MHIHLTPGQLERVLGEDAKHLGADAECKGQTANECSYCGHANDVICAYCGYVGPAKFAAVRTMLANHVYSVRISGNASYSQTDMIEIDASNHRAALTQALAIAGKRYGNQGVKAVSIELIDGKIAS